MNESPATSAVDTLADPFDTLSDAVRDHAAIGDEATLRGLLRREWTIERLTHVLCGSTPDRARLAAYCLGVLGGAAVVLPLLRALHHDDVTVATAAEDALWRIWCSSAGLGVRRRLMRAAEMMNDGRFDAAMAVLEDVVQREPDFAEGYHQRAMAWFCMAEYVNAVADYKRALALNAFHFGALTGLGHAHAQLGQTFDALRCFREALKIHPRMEGIRQSIRRVHRMNDRREPLSR